MMHVVFVSMAIVAKRGNLYLRASESVSWGGIVMSLMISLGISLELEMYYNSFGW